MVPTEFVTMLDENVVNLGTDPLYDFEANIDLRESEMGGEGEVVASPKLEKIG
jgi:hypothetical protein